MNNQREVFTGIIAAVISITIIVGSLAVATIEVQSTVAMENSATPTLTSLPTYIVLVTQRPGEPTYTPSPTLPPSPTPTPVIVSCLPPAGWSAIVLQPGDTIESLAQTYNITPNALKRANCLVGNSLASGTVFYVPGAPPPTEVIPCGPPAGWVYYIVKKGDTLYSIGRTYNVSVAQLQAANCMGSSTYIRAGQNLYVPNISPILPSSSPTPTSTETPSLEPSATPTRVLPSITVTAIAATLTWTPIPPTVTPSLSAATPVPTDTPIPPTPTFTATATPTPEPTTLVPAEWPTSTTPSTSTPYPTSTSTPEPKLVPTLETTPTATPTLRVRE